MTSARPRSWRAVLAPAVTEPIEVALGVQLRQREGDEAHWGPRRVRPATARSVETSSGELRLAVRPLVRSTATGAWVQGAETWESLRRGAWRVDTTRRRWFTTLHGIAHDARVFGGYGDSEWLTLDGVDSDLLWPHLTSADALGIPIVPSRADQDVSFAATATVELRVDAEGSGLRLATRITIDGDDPAPTSVIRPIGHVGLYSVTRHGGSLRLRLAPVAFGEAAHALLSAGGAVLVPDGEREEFLREAYPRIAREGVVIAGPRVELPPQRPAVLLIRVDLQPRDVVSWEMTWQDDVAGSIALGAGDESDPSWHRRRQEVEAAWNASLDAPFQPSGRASGIAAAELVAVLLPALAELDGVRVETSGIRRDYRELRGDPRVTITTVPSREADWFELGVLVEIDGRRIPFAPLFTALARRRKRILLSDGAYFSLAHPSLDRLRDLIDDSRDLIEWEAGPRVSRYHAPFWEDFEDVADVAAPAVAWREATAALRAAAPVDAALPIGLASDLRPYQRDGFRWLAALWDAGLGGVLADDMGLGKTLQTLALILHARTSGAARPALVVAPTSVLSTWRDEAARHAPGLTVHVATATGIRPPDLDVDVVVTSYALLRLDEAAYTASDWSVVVFDEAQALKNPRTQVHRVAQGLRARARFALTGTPLENSLVDLWAILSLTSPGLFASARRFRDEYVQPIERGGTGEDTDEGASRRRRLERLRRRLRPFLLRRTKDVVAADLPPRQEQDVRIELTSGHRAVYDRVLQRERRKVLGLLDDLDSHRFIVFRSLTLLRMLALAPSLVDAGGPGVVSSKLDALRERLVEVAAEGHRALVFSQFTSYLDLVERDLRAHGLDLVRLDGATTRREDVIRAFRDGSAPVFLISLTAGGVGLTLTEADYVFLLDPWWNPAAEQQAIGRAHRIGQSRPVTVYRLIASGTIEEKVLELQQRKARLFHSVMDADGAFSTALGADDIRRLLE